MFYTILNPDVVCFCYYQGHYFGASCSCATLSILRCCVSHRKVLWATAVCSSLLHVYKYSWNTLVELDYQVAVTPWQTAALLLVNASGVTNGEKKETPKSPSRQWSKPYKLFFVCFLGCNYAYSSGMEFFNPDHIIMWRYCPLPSCHYQVRDLVGL